MSLHPPVLFIGDRPNPKKNISMDVPFVGTPSYKTLLEWCYRMDVDVTRMSMMNAYDLEGRLTANLAWIARNTPKVITLGERAKNAIDSLVVNTFALPHPSGLNRELNDKKKLSGQLAKCRAFIYKETK